MTPTPVSTSEPDPTLEASVFWLRHKNEIVAGFIVVLLALAGLAGYWFYQQRRDSSAANLLAEAKTPEQLQNVTRQGKGTPAGATAYLLLAEQQRNEKKYTEANATLQAFLEKNPKHELASTARMANAANLESLGKLDEALATYQRVSAGDPHGFNAPLALLAQAHLLKEKNQIEEARRVCETILTQYRDSFAAGEASRQLRLLKAGTPTVAAPVANAPLAPQTIPAVPNAPSGNPPPAGSPPKP